MSDPNVPPTPTPPPVDYATPQGGGGLFSAPSIPGFPPPAEQHTMGMLCHLLALAGLVIPFGNIIGPLVMWLINKDKMAFVNDQGKEAVNFQITVTIAAIIAGIVTICLAALGAVAVGIVGLVFAVMGAIAANKGEYYRYPFSMRLIK